MLPGYDAGNWTAQTTYSPAAYYDWLKGRKPTVTWYKWLWNEHVIPKHQFIGWLYAHGALRTRDKLIKYRLDVDDRCLLCEQDAECIDHLLCECVYSRRVIQSISQKMQISFPVTNMIDCCTQRTCTKLQQGIQAALMWGVVYHIWQQRNKSNMEGILIRPKRLADQVIEEVKAILRGRDYKVITKTDLD
ncbi:uncharacterized protein LOC141628521 [Silene latifolia]|uniref:uncharacterized protein LOC141628521 n=1 Tax=Silene latifolia TaxID=37657 RepID=UPI003D783797